MDFSAQQQWLGRVRFKFARFFSTLYGHIKLAGLLVSLCQHVPEISTIRIKMASFFKRSNRLVRLIILQVSRTQLHYVCEVVGAQTRSDLPMIDAFLLDF